MLKNLSTYIQLRVRAYSFKYVLKRKYLYISVPSNGLRMIK